MKILLLNPPIPYRFRMFEYADQEAKDAISRRVLIGPPFPLNIIAGMLDKHEVIIIDQKTELDNNLQYNAEEDLAKELEKFNPDIVGITCITAQYNYAKKLLSIIKKFNKKILTVVGGLHPSAVPEDFIGSDADLLVLGLGKVIFHDVVEEFSKNKDNPNFEKIPSLAILNGNNLHLTQSLNICSYQDYLGYLRDDVFPNRKLTDKYVYTVNVLKKTIHYICTSYGCTDKCNFCSLWQLTGGRYIYRDADLIVEELRGMDKYDVIRFSDAHTFGNIKKAKELFEKIIDSNLPKHIYFADVRADSVVKHPDVMQLAAKAGLKVVVMGLEATSDEELIKYNKKSTIQNTIDALKILNENGYLVNGNYIVRPDYDEKDFERVSKFVESNPIYHSGFTILTPFPGTPQWEEMKHEIVITDFDYYNLTNAVTKTKLPEKVFYDKVAELYKLSVKSTEKYISIYGKPVGGPAADV